MHFPLFHLDRWTAMQYKMPMLNWGPLSHSKGWRVARALNPAEHQPGRMVEMMGLVCTETRRRAQITCSGSLGHRLEANLEYAAQLTILW